MFNKNWEEWNSNIPEIHPEYFNKSLSAYRYGNSIQSKDTELLCFAPGLIKQINDSPRQELATHTYSHYYCLEQGQDVKAFEADLQQCIKMADKFGIELKSLVFPRNQFNIEYLEVCKKSGIENVRSNPSSWYWKDTESDSLVNKIFRTGDAYMGSPDKSYNLAESIKVENQPLAQKASRLLRPYSNKKALNALKLKRIKKEMTKAAKAKEFYHLWWHPHNFGDYPAENLRDLEELLVHFDILKNEYGYKSLNMCETGKFITH